MVGKKQYQQIVKKTENGKIVKYWIRVADAPIECSDVQQPKQKKLTKKQLESKEKAIVWQQRQENVKKYREMVDQGLVLMGCDNELDLLGEMPTLKQEVDLSLFAK